MSQSIVNRIFGFLFPKRRYSSGSLDHPTPVDLFRAMLEKLIREDRWEWVNFDTPGSNRWIQVALSGAEFSLNFAYAFDEDPIKRLTGLGIDIPQDWKMDFLKPGQAATFAVPTDDLQDVASMVHEIFQKLLGCSSDYDVTAVLE